MSVLKNPVLMLNKNWLAIDTCTVRSSFIRLFDDKAFFLDDEFQPHSLDEWLLLEVPDGAPSVRTSLSKVRAPEIIVLRSGINPKRRTMKFSRKNLSRRDKRTCQYCGKTGASVDLTVDHVVPKKRGGKSSWKNCVMSCHECNKKKADKTLEEVGMRLLPRPEMRLAYPSNRHRWTERYSPPWSPVFRIDSKNIKENWKSFIDSKFL